MFFNFKPVDTANWPTRHNAQTHMFMCTPDYWYHRELRIHHARIRHMSSDLVATRQAGQSIGWTSTTATVYAYHNIQHSRHYQWRHSWQVDWFVIHRRCCSSGTETTCDMIDYDTNLIVEVTRSPEGTHSASECRQRNHQCIRYMRKTSWTDILGSVEPSRCERASQLQCTSNKTILAWATSARISRQDVLISEESWTVDCRRSVDEPAVHGSHAVLIGWSTAKKWLSSAVQSIKSLICACSAE